MKQLLLVWMVIAPLNASAFEQVITREAIEKKITQYRILLEGDPKNELAQLKRLIINKLPDTAWRVEDRAKKST